MAKDIYWPDTVLAMHMDAAGAIDLKGHTATAFGNAAISATQSKFGGSSATFDGSGAHFSIPTSEDFRLLDSDFTIEMWIYRTTDTTSTVMGKLSSATIESSFGLSTIVNGAIDFVMYVGLSGHSVSSISGAVPVSGWHHVAVTRTSNTLKIFVNGDLKGTNTALGGAVVNYSTAAALRIGGYGTEDTPFNGYIDDVRITKGVARYTAPFTPPVAAFPDEPYTVSGTILDINGNGVVRTVRAYRRDTGALVGTTTSLFANGTYTMPVRHDGEVQIVLVDDDAGAIENDQILRTIPL